MDKWLYDYGIFCEIRNIFIMIVSLVLVCYDNWNIRGKDNRIKNMFMSFVIFSQILVLHILHDNVLNFSRDFSP